MIWIRNPVLYPLSYGGNVVETAVFAGFISEFGENNKFRFSVTS
jgi:hypothetical protein